MFSLAIIIGIHSYLIFILGLISLLYKNTILIVTFITIILSLLWFRKEIKDASRFFTRIHLVQYKQGVSFGKLSFLLLGLIIIQTVINLIGALGPEYAFDSLWYHLTLPKIYLMNHSIFHISGGLFYYSDMPKLIEMLYIPAIALSNEITAKLIHFIFGILTLAASYHLSRKFLDKKISLLVVLVLSSNLVFAWESTTAYIDLARSFFELMALWGFINFIEKQERKWLIESGIMLGFAISTKLLALGSLLIFLILIIYFYILKKESIKQTIKDMLLFSSFSLLVPLPWFIFSFVNTGNPFYPFFSSIYKVGLTLDLLNPIKFIQDFWVLFTQAADPISPIYLAFLPLVILFFRKFKRDLKIVGIYSLVSILVWYITPRTGGGRFILPYLFAFSIIVVATLNIVKDKLIKNFAILSIILIAIITMGYRGMANYKYLPVILGKETKELFLTKNLNYSFGDFYDTDSFFKNNLKNDDKVLIYGSHNLYYADFSFIHESYVKKGDTFNYILTQDAELPKRFWYWKIIYENDKTHVKLYSLGGQEWVY